MFEWSPMYFWLMNLGEKFGQIFAHPSVLRKSVSANCKRPRGGNCGHWAGNCGQLWQVWAGRPIKIFNRPFRGWAAISGRICFVISHSICADSIIPWHHGPSRLTSSMWGVTPPGSAMTSVQFVGYPESHSFKRFSKIVPFCPTEACFWQNSDGLLLFLLRKVPFKSFPDRILAQPIWLPGSWHELIVWVNIYQYFKNLNLKSIPKEITEMQKHLNSLYLVE